MHRTRLNAFPRRTCRLWLPVLLISACLGGSPLAGATISNDLYEIGNPSLTDLWVDPVNGQDTHSGDSRATALHTLNEAWRRIPQGVPLATGYRIWLMAGAYPEETAPVYWESRYGSYENPIILQAADGPGTVALPRMNVFDTRYLYLIGVSLIAGYDDVFHCERCDHLLLRQTRIAGEPSRSLQETVKLNQSQYVYIENSDISGGWNNALDMVAVQFGHVRNNRFHDSDDWCYYAKGGSAHLIIAGNEFYDCGTGGFSAGQGAGFEYMTSPWLHYEAYDIKFVNNVIHDTDGAGMGVNGGYNILMAHNTLYQIGTRSHLFEAVFGARTCDGNTQQCLTHLNAGGWGTATSYTEGEPIPNRNVYIYNNLFYNPPGVQSQWVQFAIYGPRIPSAGSNMPAPSVTDANLQIRGNLIWNGPADHPLGIEDAGQGCQPASAACNEGQLRAENTINQLQPQLIDPAGGDFHPMVSGNVLTTPTYAVPDFTGIDAPTAPLAPVGALSNTLLLDRDGQLRAIVSPPGAYQGNSGAQNYALNLSQTGTGTGATSGGGNYPAGAMVNLTATADIGSFFAGWSPSPCAARFAMPASTLTCTATFSRSSIWRRIPGG